MWPKGSGSGFSCWFLRGFRCLKSSVMLFLVYVGGGGVQDGDAELVVAAGRGS